MGQLLMDIDGLGSRTQGGQLLSTFRSQYESFPADQLPDNANYAGESSHGDCVVHLTGSLFWIVHMSHLSLA